LMLASGLLALTLLRSSGSSATGGANTDRT
jgi:hypothetical protein